MASDQLTRRDVGKKKRARLPNGHKQFDNLTTL